jgi:hypothetical protein
MLVFNGPAQKHPFCLKNNNPNHNIPSICDIPIHQTDPCTKHAPNLI